MIYHGHFTHPDLWLMWYAIFGTTVNFTLIVLYICWRKRD